MLMNNGEYFDVLDNIKGQIREAQYKAVLGANIEMLNLYWNIGKVIIENTKYGTSFLENLSRDLQSEFPDKKGYSVSNLKNMRRFAATYDDIQKSQRDVVFLPWRNNITLMSKIKDERKRQWYIAENIKNGWNDTVLKHQIEIQLYERQALPEKVNNFGQTLPSPLSEMAEQTMKDPYIFDFVDATKAKIERKVERELVANIKEFLLELGNGFAFVGEQYPLQVDGQDFYIDLLFYNLALRCYVVIELKNTKFKPEFAGQLNFYLNAVNGELCKENDNPTIGLLLCKEKSNFIAEYALKKIDQPIGVSEYKIFEELPKEFEDKLPSAEDIEKRVKLELEIQEGDDNAENE